VISGQGSAKPQFTTSTADNRIAISVTNADFNGQVLSVKITPKAK